MLQKSPWPGGSYESLHFCSTEFSNPGIAYRLIAMECFGMFNNKHLDKIKKKKRLLYLQKSTVFINTAYCISQMQTRS